MKTYVSYADFPDPVERALVREVWSLSATADALSDGSPVFQRVVGEVDELHLFLEAYRTEREKTPLHDSIECATGDALEDLLALMAKYGVLNDFPQLWKPILGYTKRISEIVRHELGVGRNDA